MNTEQLQRMHTGKGFIAALDQSGGSTPKALAAYGISADQFTTDEEMFQLVHAMRTRIILTPAFTNEKILGVILFENTMDRQIEGQPTADYLWNEKGIVPFLKIDKGLAEEKDDVQLMKPNPNLEDLLQRAKAAHIFGTKERSVIWKANEHGIKEVVAQQFEIAKRVLAQGLVPIIEPEVSITSEEKAAAEALLKPLLLKELAQLPADARVIFKLTLPETANFYDELAADERTVRVVALSGGYERTLANQKLAENHHMIASFSRALVEGLHADQTAEAFDKELATTIEEIFQASIS